MYLVFNSVVKEMNIAMIDESVTFTISYRRRRCYLLELISSNGELSNCVVCAEFFNCELCWQKYRRSLICCVILLCTYFIHSFFYQIIASSFQSYRIDRKEYYVFLAFELNTIHMSLVKALGVSLIKKMTLIISLSLLSIFSLQKY